MQEPPPQSASPRPAIVSFRCFCGETVRSRERGVATCGNCGRFYSCTAVVLYLSRQAP